MGNRKRPIQPWHTPDAARGECVRKLGDKFTTEAARGLRTLKRRNLRSTREKQWDRLRRAIRKLDKAARDVQEVITADSYFSALATNPKTAALFEMALDGPTQANGEAEVLGILAEALAVEPRAAALHARTQAIKASAWTEFEARIDVPAFLPIATEYLLRLARERRQAIPVTATLAALLAIASESEPPIKPVSDEQERWGRVRKRWDEALRKAKAEVGRNPRSGLVRQVRYEVEWAPIRRGAIRDPRAFVDMLLNALGEEKAKQLLGVPDSAEE